jgi:TonB family protein
MTEALTSPLAQAVGLALVHFLWQGAAIGLGAAALLGIARRAPAQLRYVVASAALVALAAAPVVTTTRLLRAGPAATSIATAVSNAIEPPSTATPSAAAIATPASRSSSALTPVLPLVVIGWSLGVALLSLRLARGWLDVRRIRRHASGHVPAALASALERIAVRVGVPRHIAMAESTMVDTPTLIGWIRPVILVPTAALAGLAPSQLEAVLLHEIAHIRRHDYLINNLQHIVETALFYHPAVWWVSNEMRREREHCCDDAVIEALGDRVVYAQTLAALEESRQRQVAFGVAATGGHLVERVRRLLGAKPLYARRPSIAIVACLVIGLAALAASGRSASAVQQPEQAPTPALPRQTEMVFVGAPQTVRPGSVTPVAPTPRPAAPQTRPTPLVPATTWEVEIRELEERFRLAKLQNDIAALEQMVDDDYSGVNQTGRRRNKTEFIELFRTFPIQSLTLGAMTVQANADRGVVNGEMREISGTSTYPMLFTRVWVRFGNTWRLLSNTQFRDPRPPSAFEAISVTRTDRPLRVGGDIREPIKIRHVNPVYPEQAREAKVSGIVILEAVVDETGTPTSVTVLRGHPMLDEAAVTAVGEWRYTPTLFNGQPVSVMLTITVNFTLAP